jgi:hypothetical protein
MSWAKSTNQRQWNENITLPWLYDIPLIHTFPTYFKHKLFVAYNVDQKVQERIVTKESGIKIMIKTPP